MVIQPIGNHGPKLKVLITRLVLVLEVMVNQPMGNHWESFGVVIFDLGPLLQGQMRIAKLKSGYNSLLIFQVWQTNI